MLFLIVLGGLLYLVTLHSGFNFDDSRGIVDNPAIRNWNDFGTIFAFWPSRCLLFWTLALNYRLNGLDVFGYHLFNTVVHILSSFLVYLIFLHLKPEKTRISDGASHSFDRAALLAALIFLAHPLQTQAVTYIIQRGVSLAGFFSLLAIFFYIRGRRDKSPIALAGAWLAGLLAAFSKEGAIILPLLLLTWEFMLGPKESWSRKIPPLIPFAALPLILLAVLTATAQSSTMGLFYTVNLLKGKIPELSSGGAFLLPDRWEYFLTQINVLCTYLRLLVLPVRQSLIYDYPISNSLFLGPVIVRLLFLLTIVIAALRLTRSHKVISFGILFFFIALIPTSSVFVLIPVIAEHHLYLSLAGFSWVLSSLFFRLSPNGTGRWRSILTGGLLLCIFLLAFRRNTIWGDSLALWSDALKQSPESHVTHNNLGLELYRLGRFEEAAVHFRRAFALEPANAFAHNNLGAILYQWGSYNEAEAHYRRALEIDPAYAPAHYNLGNFWDKMGKYDRAISHFNSALDINPGYGDVLLNLANVLVKQDQLAEAVLYYNRALAAKGESIEIRYNLVMVLDSLGRAEEALDHLNVILKLRPDFPAARQKYEQILKK